MKLRNRSKGTLVAIRENALVYDHKKVNTYDLIISVGKGKKRAMMLRHALEKLLHEVASAAAQQGGK